MIKHTLNIIAILILGGVIGRMTAPQTSAEPSFEHKPARFQEVRDSYFRKCTSNNATARTDGAVEELWDCGGTPVFVVKKFR